MQLTGYVSPGIAVKMEQLGKGFIKIVTLFIYPIIFLTITLGISGMTNLKSRESGSKAIIYFEIVTTFALIIGVIVVNIIKPGSEVSTSNIRNRILLNI